MPCRPTLSGGLVLGCVSCDCPFCHCLCCSGAPFLPRFASKCQFGLLAGSSVRLRMAHSAWRTRRAKTRLAGSRFLDLSLGFVTLSFLPIDHASEIPAWSPSVLQGFSRPRDRPKTSEVMFCRPALVSRDGNVGRCRDHQLAGGGWNTRRRQMP